MKAFALFFLCFAGCAATEPDPLAGPEAPPPDFPPKACLVDAKIAITNVIETASGGTLAHVRIEGLESYTRVEFAYAGAEPSDTRPLLPPVPNAFTRRAMDPEPKPRVATSSGGGFFSAMGNLLKGAVVGLTNLVMLPVNLPLSIIDSRHEIFPFSWNSGSISDSYPSAVSHPFFEDGVLDETQYAAKKASYDLRVGPATAKTMEADRRAREASYARGCFVNAGVFECDVRVKAESKSIEAQLRSSCDRTISAELPAREPYVVIDESLGASKSADAWYKSFGTRSPQLVAAASAEDAFKLAATSEDTTLNNSTVACRVITKRSDAKKKRSVLAVRFSFGDLMAVGATVQARGGGEPMTFIVPNVTLASHGQVKIAVLDSSSDWGGAAVVAFEDKALSFAHERFDAECRILGAAQTKSLAARSLERLRAQPDLPDAAFDFDPKNEARQNARLKLFDGVRDIEALVGRQSDEAKAAQKFADERIKSWTVRVQQTLEPLVARAQPEMTVGDATLRVASVDPRMQACTVKGTVSAKKKINFSLEQTLKKVRFLDKNGNVVEPFFLEPDGTVAVTPDKAIAIQFDIPAVNKADVCAVAVPKGGPQSLIIPLIIKAEK